MVARDARRRWMLVGAGVLALCLLPAVVAAWPTRGAQADPAELRRLILASAKLPYQGYVDSQARLGVPDLPELSDVVGLFSGTTTLRVWYSSARAWRVAVLDPTGERDVYRTAAGTHVWDFERNAVTETAGDLPVRLPSGADLLPPTLARRLLSAAPDDPVVSVPSRRIAGVTAAGLRLTPTDPDTTAGRLEIWADPHTGLPLQVTITARGERVPVIDSRFLELDQSTPDRQLLTPTLPDSAGLTTTTGPAVSEALGTLALVPLPPRLAGRAQSGASTVVGVGSYGTGLSTFVAVAIRGRNAARTFDAIHNAGAVAVPIAGAEAYQLSSPMLAMVAVRVGTPGRNRRTYLLAGPVTPELLVRAGQELLAGVQ